MDKPATPLPCPFCGGNPSLLSDVTHPTAWEIECPGISCPIRPSAWEEDKPSAIAAWNRRVPDPHLTAINAELVEALEFIAPLLDYIPHPHCVVAIDMVRTALARAKENSNA